ncbi:PKD domain-containing protein [Chitinophaga costaii]|nr:PKD domain-containing protein [Chitinophaga costaii]
MYYAYIGKDANGQYQYRITLKLYRVCDVSTSGNGLAPMPPDIYFSVFDKKDNSQVGDNHFTALGSLTQKSMKSNDPCMVNPPTVCFQIGTYTTTVTLPLNDQGYVVAFQSCCRDENMANIQLEVQQGGQRGTGATYFTEIPGSLTGIPGDNSPIFDKDSAIIVCADKKFTYTFTASDPDNDSLVYSFCDAYKGGKIIDGQSGGVPDPSDPPPYQTVGYYSPYSGGAPLGVGAVIDPHTGIISGIAPQAGKYVVTVCVSEYRNGQLIGIHHKDFHISVTTCVKYVTADTPDKYAQCDGLTINFINNSTIGRKYFWDFGDGDTLTTYSTDPLPHTYKSANVYHVKLVVDPGNSCYDSTTTVVYAFPQFFPSLGFKGLCAEFPTQLNNTSYTNNAGDFVAYTRWDFGTGVAADTSLEKNPVFKFPATGDYTVTMLVRTDKGCEQTLTQKISIYDKPPLTATGDTVMCAKDDLQLNANSSLAGTYSWSPLYDITNANTATPTVSPQLDTAYTVTFTDQQGCTNTARTEIDVKSVLLVNAPPDSTICTGDTVHLHASSDGPYAITWLELPSSRNLGGGADLDITPDSPVEHYEVLATLGSCSATDEVTYTLVNPPVASAGMDTTICYGETAFLHASGGSSYRWTPAALLSKTNVPDVKAFPKSDYQFIVTVTDTLGCPRAVSDTMLVTVVPQINAFAGNDTIIVLGQAFQLHGTGTGGYRYTWTPTDMLTNPNIADPITNSTRDITYTLTVYTQEGCVDQDDINIRFMNGPNIYVPNAFSPNGDGKNDIFRPLPVGILQIQYFSIYDRWGNEMFSTNEYMKGWDGTFHGQVANMGTYVWMVRGLDQNKKIVMEKGTVTLIR